MKPPPQIPAGGGSLLASATENFSFHSSPEAFLTSRILQHHKDHPDAVAKREPVRAKILNRDVIILSSYNQIKQVLDPPSSDSSDNAEPSAFVAVDAYDQLMTPFFPPPNLLLNDGEPHDQMKNTWNPCSHTLASLATSDALKGVVTTHLQSLPLSTPFDLYDNLKDLTWRISLAVFLDLSPSDPSFPRIVSLQEDLLRGQFSLVPISAKVPGVGSTPRKKGIDARETLQTLLEEILAVKRPAWLSHLPPSTDKNEIVNHALMATSSLSTKATTSFLLAFLLNMFIYRPPQPEARSWSNAAEISQPDERQRRIEAVVQETLRLSPPIAGVMRRASRETTIATDDQNSPDILVPRGWDVWCYFPGANRDPAVYGIAEDQELLRPIRFHGKIRPAHRLPLPFAFGAGGKSCLGEGFVRTLAGMVYDCFVEAGLELENGEAGDDGRHTGISAGVQGWLGWADGVKPEDWAKGMKQLPTQRPKEPVMVRLERRQTVYWTGGGGVRTKGDEAFEIGVTGVGMGGML